MNVGILQLSDIHMELNNNSILLKYEKIPRAIQEHIFELDHLFLTITGDSAYSGKEEEYIQVIEMLEGIKEKIQTIKNIDITFIIIPGNHDCNFKLGNPSVRNALIENIQEGSKLDDQGIIDELVKPQEKYFDYLKYFEPSTNIIYDDKLLKSYLFSMNGHNIIFNCLNSSWISVLREKPGGLFYPIEKYREHLSSLKGELVVSAIHHPRNWYYPENSRILNNFLEKYSDLILTGHEHVSTVRKIDDFEGGTTQHIEGGVLQETGVTTTSEFNFIIFNLVGKIQKIIRYSWNEDYYSSIFETEWLAYSRSASLTNSAYLLSVEFSNLLNDPGINIKHPRKTKVLLEDIYLFPDAKKVLVDENTDKKAQIINLDKITTYYENFKIFIFGAERSGKSAFCKMVFNHFYNRGYVPVYLNAVDIKGTSITEFNKLLYKRFSFQYSDEMLEKYRQLEQKKKIIIIDDLHKCKQNNDLVLELLSNLLVVYPNIIVTGNEMLKFSNLLSDGEFQNDSMDNFEKYEIIQFGHLKRSQLVDKWNRIGQVNLSENEILEKHDLMVADINTVIGNNFVPSYPFFLLILLQTAESGLPHNNKDSAYGYYYELLITQSFMNINMQHNEIDAYYTYIAELAYEFFNKDIYEFSKLEFIDFNDYMSKKYGLNHDLERTLKRLVNSSIIELYSGTYRFKYSYIYYYFVAKYFSMKITDEKIRNIIAEMCRNLHIEEYANILMFLTHLSKDPFILDSLYVQAQEVFKEFDPTKLDNDIELLNKLAVEIPRIVYQSIEVKKHREEKLIAKDEVERSMQETAVTAREPRSRRKDSVMDVVSRLNVAFKTIEILGQILRNYYGSIEATEKNQLATETYMIGLRTLNSFLSLISDNVANIASKIQRMIERQETNPNKPEIEKLARKILFDLCCAISYQAIIKVAESVGSKELYLTYRQITNQNPFTSVKLIEISIKLDQLRTLPFNDIKTLKESIEDNVMAMSILRVLVINHLYMYDTNYTEKQRICSLLNIPIGKQLSIDLTSTQKKNR
ncbi:metallophosphoesterase [Paenibacillus peoriae]|uniref:metallophosphoesterase n=1 Tax=Paenibacillus peoriae TaxID=59893 RepID=UPI00096FBC58|nr:metallophosphoesterase [Paenibacillus peoriae]OMF28478.1 hypothetical protein BK134_18750 [Paenibacillus peoriae]